MKLPGVQYGGVQGVSAPSPQQAVTEYGQKQAILDKATTAANKIANSYRDFKVTQADAAYADEMSNFRREAAKKSILTPGEVAALDIDVDTEGKEYLTKSEWYPKLLAKRMEEYRGKHAATIRSPIDRNKWLGEVSRNDNKILDKEVEIAAKETLAFKDQELIANFNDAIEKRDFVTAEAIKEDPTWLRSPASEGQRESLSIKLDTAKENAATEDFDIDFNHVLDTGTDAEVDALIAKMIDPEQRASLPVNEKNARILTSRAKAEKARREADYKTRVAESDAERNKLAKDAYSDFKTATESGKELDANTVKLVEQQVAGTDYQEPFELVQKVDLYSVQSASDRKAELDSLNDGTLESVDEYKAYTIANAKIAQGVKQEGYGFGVRQGIVRYVPLEMDNPRSWEARRIQADELSAHYGMQVSPLANGEAAQIASDVAGNTTRENMALIATFRDTPAVWEQFSENGAGVFALVGVSGDDQLSYDALEGQKKIDQKVAVLPKQSEYMLDTNDYFGGVYNGSPETKRDIIDTTLALYAQAAPSGDEEGEFDDGVWAQSLERATGGVGQVNGGYLQLPRGTHEDTMQDFVNDFDTQQVIDLGGVANVPDDQAAELIQESKWVSYGNNRYILTNGNTTLMSGANPSQPLIIEYDEDIAIDQRATEYANKQRRAGIKELPRMDAP